LPESQLHDAKIILTNLAEINGNYEPLIRACNISFRSPLWNDKKITAHHAIIPTTNSNVSLDRMSKEEQELYDLICRYYIAQFLGDYRYIERSVVIDCDGETFKATHHSATDLRWKLALGQEKGDIEDNKENSDEDKLSTLPKLTIGENLQLTSHKMLSKKTQPPARFTEGTLIEAMKSIGKTVSDNTHKKILKDTAGIGTEATRAGIIETLFKRGYLETKGKQIQATAKGKSLISYLPNMVSDPVLTATWEQQLEEIANGKANLATFMQDQKTLITNMITQIAGQ
jgi:DNA topoisomerase-3